MGLITCPDCNRQISDSARDCPGCGRPMNDPHKSSGDSDDDKKSSLSGLSGCLVVVLVIIIVGAISSIADSCSGKSASQSPPEHHDLNAAVTFTGSQFRITNRDAFGWLDCKLEVNPKTFSSGFIAKLQELKPNDTAIIGAMQFANGDGQRFNPFAYKPTSMSIYCRTPKGGSYYGAWQ